MTGTGNEFSLIVQAEEVEAVLANTKQILNQFLHKSRILFNLSILSFICMTNALQL